MTLGSDKDFDFELEGQSGTISDAIITAELLQNQNKEIQAMTNSDAIRIAEDVRRLLNSHYPEVIAASNRWTTTTIAKLEETVTKILHNNMQEYRGEVIKLVQYHIASNVHGVGPLQPIMDDLNATEIEVMDWDLIYQVDFTGRRLSDVKFASKEAYVNFVTKLVDGSNNNLSAETPIADFVLPNKTRVNITSPWVTVNQDYYTTMRKPPAAVRKVGKEQLLEFGAFTEDMYELLKLNSDGKANVILSGETNSGKTTLIRLFMDMIDPKRREKIIILQDTAEIDSIDREKIFLLLQTINRKVDPITYFDLLKSTLRMNPDRTWIGEIRGEEAAEMIESNLAGARGTMTTGHASSVEDMIMRLIILMYRAGFNFGENLIRMIVHQSVDFIYQTQILPDGSKKIVDISEILPLHIAEKEGSPTGIRKIYQYQLRDVKMDDHGQIVSIEGEHKFMQGLSEHRRRKLLMYGIIVPDKFGGVPRWN